MDTASAGLRPHGTPNKWQRALRHRFDPDERFGIRLTLLAASLILVALPFGFLLDQVTNHGSLVHTDASAAVRLHAWVVHSPGRIRVLREITFFGSGQWLFGLVGVGAIVVAARRRPRLAVFLVVTAAFGGIIDSIVKLLVSRPRPVFTHPVLLEPGKSFPSGHAMSSTVVYGALLVVFAPLISRTWRRLALALVVTLVATIGFTRLALGVHFLTDVLGGYVLGLAWLSLSAAAFSVWRQERTGRSLNLIEGLASDVAESPPC